MKTKLIVLYLSYINEFLTLEVFAEYYDLTIQKADRIIKIGKSLAHKRAEQNKQKAMEALL